MFLVYFKENWRHCNLLNFKKTLPHGICYSHYGNGVCNGAISIAQWDNTSIDIAWRN